MAEKKEEKAEKAAAETYTKYEKARIIGARALQISSGAPFLVKLSDGELEKLRYSPVKVAELEFEKGLIPIQVKKEVRKE
ncbi:DNA-directed RNA polymerase subunit K [Candidatus Woesearchaeota archaeon]|nr:DNA-directed RNA polymerase subunit K [Candidatus Woesearchaeota archaeon]